jgi:hypothetical protein
MNKFANDPDPVLLRAVWKSGKKSLEVFPQTGKRELEFLGRLMKNIKVQNSGIVADHLQEDVDAVETVKDERGQ